MRVLRQLLHPKLGVKLIISVVVAVCVAVGVQFVISSRTVGTNLERLEERRLEDDLGVASNAVQKLMIDMERATAAEAASADLIAAVRRRDADYIFEHFTSWVSTAFDVQSVTVLDRDGRLLDSVGPPLADLQREDVVQKTLKNVVSAELTYREGRLWLIGAAAIAPADSVDAGWGTLVLAEPIDDRFARAVSAITNTDITIFVHGNSAATNDRDLMEELERAQAPDRLRDPEEVVRTGTHATKAAGLGVTGADAFLAVTGDRDQTITAREALRHSMFVAVALAVALAVGVALLLAFQFGRPLRVLRSAVTGVAFGDLDQRVKVGGDDEIAALGRAFNAMAERVSVAQETLRRAAVRDSLTGLLNHREFYRRLTDELARCERGNMPLSVMMIDLDRFKDVNDTYGHLRGDAVLREVASLIARCVREEDVVARYAGDEYAVILPGVAEGTALRVAERIMSGVDGVTAGADLPRDQLVTLSVGVAVRWPGEHTATRTVELADEALYRAKESGRNRVEVAEDIIV